MAFGEKIIPLGGINVDVHESLMTPNQARFIKNLVYEVIDTATASAVRGGQTGVFKPCESNARYIENLVLPGGTNATIGALAFRELRQVYVFVYNSLGNHTVYRLNGADITFDIVYQGPCLNFQLIPENFIHFGGCVLVQTFVQDPDTLEEMLRTFLMFTSGFGNQLSICVEDSIATSSFSATLFPYFVGNYDKCRIIQFGVPTPSDCISISEVPVTVTSEAKNNKLLFKTWQFRLLYADVWGRPSEHGIISDMYIPSANDCISSASALARCLNLVFAAPPPWIDKVQVEYRNCNSDQWYLSDVLDLYNGSPLGEWWLRSRNNAVDYDSSTNTISYQFCADKQCDPIAPADTLRLFNPIPNDSVAIAQIGDSISLWNNSAGFLPFPQDLKDNITWSVLPPSSTSNTNNKFRNISILVEIHNPFYNQNQPIYRQDITSAGVKANGFGAWLDIANMYRSFFAYKQYFINLSQLGFVGYLAGTPNFTISTQWVLRPDGTFSEVPVIDGFPILFSTSGVGYRYFQKFVFTNVPAGTYVFRIAAHQTDPSVTPTYQQTSTYTVGTYAFNFNNASDPVNHNLLVSHAKELVVDVCVGNYDSTTDDKILVIWDLVTGDAVRAGYFKNTDDTTQDQLGIELLKVSGGDRNSYFTDHNGFFFAAAKTDGFSGHGFSYHIFGYCNCRLTDFTNAIDSGYQHQLGVDNWFANKLPTCRDLATQACFYTLIEGKVTLCNGTGIPGVSVVYTRGGQAVTTQDGTFTLIAHDDTYNPMRQDTLYFMSNSCAFEGCTGGCIDSVVVTILKCTTCTARTTAVAPVLVGFFTARGLLSGGVYPVGVVPWDGLDRPAFVQQDPSYYITIPSVQETQIFAPSSVVVNILPGAVFPLSTKYLTFWIGAETTIQDYITWIVDSVQFIDNTGLINNVAPTQIKIFYASLIEYNKQNNFNTTVNWNFITAGTSNPVTSDVVEFLLNGDGTFFPKAISALVKYDTTGQYFLINYTSDLAGLLPNAIIRIVRPKACTGTEPYFEVCFKVPVVNGHAQVSSFTLNAWDTYYISRQIPVPTLQPNSSPPVFINEPRVFGVPFESQSPSDFWGEDCHNIGRVNSKNPYETIIYTPEQCALSGGLSATGQLNFLNYFDTAKMTDFRDTEINGAIAVLPENNTILVLGQSDNFVVGFSDNLVRVNAQGVATAPSIDNAFGQPERKIGSNHGCMLFDKNTIYKKDGIVQFLDSSKGGVAQHNYQSCVLISRNGADGLVRAKINAVQAYNVANGNTRYFTGVINPINHEYLLTDHIIGSTNFINNLRGFDVTAQETLSFDVYGKLFKATYSFTPEYYCELEGEVQAQQLFSFVNGIAYRHYTTADSKSFGTFYDQVVERVLEVVIVMDNLKKKKPLSLGEYCKQGVYFVDRVLTETGQETRMLISQFLQAEFGWYAPFLCDLNTPLDPNIPIQTGPNKLMDGNMLTGTWIMIRLVGDPALNTSYSELQGITTQVFPSEKSGA